MLCFSAWITFYDSMWNKREKIGVIQTSRFYCGKLILLVIPLCASILKTVITGEVCARDTRNGVITPGPPECHGLRNNLIVNQKQLKIIFQDLRQI